jgi:hypothetical protein
MGNRVARNDQQPQQQRIVGNDAGEVSFDRSDAKNVAVSLG